MPGSRPIIIIKKKGGHGGHHGGAWKVAYADFVTAMMALFIVLWLLNTNKPVREAIAGYFKDPSGTANKIGSNKAGAAEAVAITKDDMPKLKEELEKAIRGIPNFEKFKNQIEMTLTPEGLRIELLETETGTFFDVGNPAPNNNGKELLSLLARELGKLPNHLSIEGHTDSKPYTGGPGQCRPAIDAEQRFASRPGYPSAWLRRSDAAQERPTAGRIQSSHLRDRAESGKQAGGARET
jgi:chemotaxis protein MotB